MKKFLLKLFKLNKEYCWQPTWIDELERKINSLICLIIWHLFAKFEIGKFIISSLAEFEMNFKVFLNKEYREWLYRSDYSKEIPKDTFYCDTSIKNYDSFLQSTQEKTFARIISIEDDATIIELFLPKGEFQKKLNNYYVEKLKNKNLHYEGAEFNIAYQPTEDGMNIKIEPVILNRSQKVNQIFSALGLEC